MIDLYIGNSATDESVEIHKICPSELEGDAEIKWTDYMDVMLDALYALDFKSLPPKRAIIHFMETAVITTTTTASS